jgi:pimeloyl-ACP methyl ester carboxylesterase
MSTAIAFNTSPYNPLMRQCRVNLENGQCLYVEIGGEPTHPSILLIMGLGGQVLHWPDAFCQQLIQAGFQIIRYDHRDVGLSSKIKAVQSHKLSIYPLMARYSLGLASQGAAYTLYDMAQDASLLIKALGMTQVHVIGASMGGMIAQILAAKYPQQVLSLGLLFSSNNQRLLPPPFPKQLLALLSQPKADDEEQVIGHALKIYNRIGSPGHIDATEATKTARLLYRRNYYPSGTFRHFLAILCTGSLLYLDKQIHGSRDRLLPPAHGKAVAKAINNAKFELIEGLGHDLPPYFLTTIVQSFVQHIRNLIP